MNLPLQGQAKSLISVAGVLAGRIKGIQDEEILKELREKKTSERLSKEETKKADKIANEEAKKIKSEIDIKKKRAEAEVERRRAEIEKSREFAKMITEGVYTTSLDPATYIPPAKKE